jgi:2-polyprenyl-3-methyl-5-hydroxy-6-metoxy-1,4-benzoquinol methylase
LYNSPLKTSVVERIGLVDPMHWQQISRTVNGVAVDSEQIRLMVESVIKGLELCESDVLLDIGCGNGALSWILAANCKFVTGIDPNYEFLKVASSYSESEHRLEFESGSLPLGLVASQRDLIYNKALIYGVFAYVHSPKVALEELRKKYSKLGRVYVGQIPDASRKSFFTKGTFTADRLSRFEDSIGSWFEPSEFVQMAKEAGWEASLVQMPKSFYSAHYRFDAILRPAA